jgi:hypothetical protein
VAEEMQARMVLIQFLALMQLALVEVAAAGLTIKEGWLVALVVLVVVHLAVVRAQLLLAVVLALLGRAITAALALTELTATLVVAVVLVQLANQAQPLVVTLEAKAETG